MEHCLDKTQEKKFGGPQIEFEIRVGVLPFSKGSISVGQCLTASRVGTSKKNFLGKIGAEMIFSILMSSFTQTCLFPSKLTAMHIATKTNETNTKSKSFKKARCLCNRKVIIMFSSISKCFTFYFTLIVYSRPRMC